MPHSRLLTPYNTWSYKIECFSFFSSVGMKLLLSDLDLEFTDLSRNQKGHLRKNTRISCLLSTLVLFGERSAA